jgi:enamine deaminase RidA (YjgF/YER057c/UK114 family)
VVLEVAHLQPGLWGAKGSKDMTNAVTYVNPDSLHKSPAYTQVVVVTNPAKTIYIGAQTALDKDGQIVGKGDIAAQTAQVLKNIELCLEAANAKPENLISWNIYLLEGQDLQAGFEVGMKWWGQRPNPPLNTVFYVPSFGNTDFLLMIEAIAVL